MNHIKLFEEFVNELSGVPDMFATTKPKTDNGGGGLPPIKMRRKGGRGGNNFSLQDAEEILSKEAVSEKKFKYTKNAPPKYFIWVTDERSYDVEMSELENFIRAKVHLANREIYDGKFSLESLYDMMSEIDENEFKNSFHDDEDEDEDEL